MPRILRKHQWYINISGREDDYHNEEVDFTVWKNKKIIEGGIDSHMTGLCTYRGMEEKANSLLKAYPESTHVSVSDRRFGDTLYEARP